jgi:uncharacterized protein
MSVVSPRRADVAEALAGVEARSHDGRSFDVRGATGQLQPGDHLVVADSLLLVEQVDTRDDMDHARAAALTSDGPVGRAPARRATDAEVAEVLAGNPPGAVLGHLVQRPAVPVGLLAHRLNRHTFWCGQSGSGKTYALGVALEQVLMRTRLPVVVLDPNSDFVRLGEPTAACAPQDRTRLNSRDVRVLSAGAGADALTVRFRTMSPRARAAVLRLDPVDDRHEYHVLNRLRPAPGDGPDAVVRALTDLGGSDGAALLERLQNLQVLEWDVWSYDREPATEVVARRPAAAVLDLGSLQRTEEQLAVALAVLDDLWERRERREPVLLVIDEAHTLAAPDPGSPLGRAVLDRLVQIAAEGRKYGLWLLLSTQRPSRVHRAVVSQCDNLTLMRMNSPVDLAELGEVFGFVPPGMLARSPRFRQGEALVAGGFVAAPSILRMGTRLTQEGGIDVPVPLGAARGDDEQPADPGVAGEDEAG